LLEAENVDSGHLHKDLSNASNYLLPNVVAERKALDVFSGVCLSTW